jgi:hypothetical protein
MRYNTQLAGAVLRVLPISSIDLQVTQSSDDKGRATERRAKQRRLTASIGRAGLIQPIVVRDQQGATGRYLLLDGYNRYQALVRLRTETAECLYTSDEAAVPHAPMVCHLTVYQQHAMVLRGIERGLTEMDLRRELGFSRMTVQRLLNLVRGIGDEALARLRCTWAPRVVYDQLRKARPSRQVRIADLMLAMNNFSEAYVTALIASSAPGDLLDPACRHNIEGLRPADIARFERARQPLEEGYLRACRDYGVLSLHLAVLASYVRELLNNPRVDHCLAQRHPAIHAELQRIAEPYRDDRRPRKRTYKRPAKPSSF